MPHAGAGTWVLMTSDPLVPPIPCLNEHDADARLLQLEDPGWRKEFIERGGL